MVGLERRGGCGWRHGGADIVRLYQCRLDGRHSRVDDAVEHRPDADREQVLHGTRRVPDNARRRYGPNRCQAHTEWQRPLHWPVNGGGKGLDVRCGACIHGVHVLCQQRVCAGTPIFLRGGRDDFGEATLIEVVKMVLLIENQPECLDCPANWKCCQSVSDICGHFDTATHRCTRLERSITCLRTPCEHFATYRDDTVQTLLIEHDSRLADDKNVCKGCGKRPQIIRLNNTAVEYWCWACYGVDCYTTETKLG